MVVDFTSQVGITLVGRLKHDLRHGQSRVTSILCRLVRTFEPLVSLWVARYTFPKEPFPINRPSV